MAAARAVSNTRAPFIPGDTRGAIQGCSGDVGLCQLASRASQELLQRPSSAPPPHPESPTPLHHAGLPLAAYPASTRVKGARGYLLIATRYAE